MSLEQGKKHVEMMRSFLALKPELPLRAGKVNISQLFRMVGYKYRTPVYENAGVTKLLVDYCKRHGYILPMIEPTNTDSKTSNKNTESLLLERNREIKKLNNKIIELQNQFQTVIEENKVIKKALQNALSDEDHLLETGREIRRKTCS